MSCHTERSKYLCLYVTLVIRTHLQSIQSLCKSTNKMLSMHSFGWRSTIHTNQMYPSMNQMMIGWRAKTEQILVKNHYSVNNKKPQRYKVLTTQEEMVSNAHSKMDFSDCAGNTCDIEISAMHPNVGNSLPNAHNTKIIQSLIDIAKNTDQPSKIMNIPSIDHNNPVKWVLLFNQVIHITNILHSLLHYWYKTNLCQLISMMVSWGNWWYIWH